MASIDTDKLESLGLSRQLGAKKKDNLGQGEFLKLMTTQLQNQDPFKPMESGEFLSQIAQFSTVSGIQDLQKSFSSLAGSLHSNQALQASSLVGRTVMVPGDKLLLPSEGSAFGTLDLPSGAEAVTVRVRSASGTLINEMDLGPQGRGLLDIAWDGTTADGESAPPGVYTFEASARIAGTETAVDTLSLTPVESVTLDNKKGSLSLNLLGMGAADFEQVKEIR